MSNQQNQAPAKDQYAVTTRFFQAYGGAIDNEVTAYVNEYSKVNSMRLINVVVSERQFVFFWVQK